MIILSFPEKNGVINEWIEQLDELIVSYRLIEDSKLKEPQLKNGKATATGVGSIQTYLKAFEQEVLEWRKPGCGK